MAIQANENNAPFAAFFVEGGDHFDLLAPLTRLVADKILQDTGAQCNVHFSAEEVTRAYARQK